MSKDKGDTPIELLGLSPSSLVPLQESNIYTIEKLLTMRDSTILNIKGINKKALVEIKYLLDKRGQGLMRGTDKIYKIIKSHLNPF